MRMAGFGAVPASLGATLAMLMLVFSAFFGAVAADSFADGEYLVRKFAVAQQQAGRKHANVRAIPVQFNAMCHWRYIILVKAGRAAGFAVLRTMQQCVNELLVLVAAVVVRWFLWFVAFHVC